MQKIRNSLLKGSWVVESVGGREGVRLASPAEMSGCIDLW